MTNYLRPDELADKADIGRMRSKDEMFKGGLKTAASAIGGAGVTGLSSKIVPFLSQYISPDLAVKGISKVNPKLGEYLQKGMSMGLPIEEGLDFIKQKLEPTKQETEKKGSMLTNEIGQFSPKLQDFIEQGIQGGKSPDHAAALAMPRAEFSEIIRNIEKKSKKKFTALVRELYEGKAVQQSPQEHQMTQPQKMQQGQQSGQGQQALMATLQKINQRLGG